MDSKTLVAIAAMGSFCAAVLGGVLAWLLVNERRIARLEKGQERMESAVSEGIQRIDASIKDLRERLDTHFTNSGRKS